MPTLDADEREARVTYYASTPDFETEPRVTVVFSPCVATLFGPPSDETLHGHPLYDRGLTFYGAFEVQHSSWVRALERMNSVHPSHRPDGYREIRHLVITFHDSTFECLATGFSVLPVSLAT